MVTISTTWRLAFGSRMEEPTCPRRRCSKPWAAVTGRQCSASKIRYSRVSLSCVLCTEEGLTNVQTQFCLWGHLSSAYEHSLQLSFFFPLICFVSRQNLLYDFLRLPILPPCGAAWWCMVSEHFSTDFLWSLQEMMLAGVPTASFRSSRCLTLPTWCWVMECLLLHVLTPTKTMTGWLS